MLFRVVAGLSLPPSCLAAVVPGGGRACFVACRPCQFGTRRGACLFPRLPTLPLVYFPAPYPPDPLPGGKGEILGYFMQGASPLASPAFDRLRHVQTLPCRYPGIKPLAAQAEPEKQAPGEGLPRCCRLTLPCRGSGG